MKKIYRLKHDVAERVHEMVAATPFTSEDVVLHIRRTDKIMAYNGSVVESGELSVATQVMDTISAMRSTISADGKSLESRTLFILTDDELILDECKEIGIREGIKISYEPVGTASSLLHLKRMGGTITQEESLQNIYETFVIIEYMTQCSLLVGGRYSYLFRVGELLRWPLKSINLKDSDIFGVAQYAEVGTPLVMPMFKKRYTDIINTESLCQSSIDNVHLLKDALSTSFKKCILRDIDTFLPAWYTKVYHPTIDTCRAKADLGQFAYQFSRSMGKHHDTCYCIVCKLVDTVKSHEFISILSSAVSNRVVSFGEMFLSKYETGDYLTIHHDSKKGDYAFVVSLTDNWCPAWGGLTHFLDKDRKTIIHTICPSLGDVFVFKVETDETSHHFVSQVSGPHARYAFTGWFNV